MQTTINVSDTLQEEPHTPAPEDTPTPEATPTQQEEGTPNAATSDMAAALAPVEEEIIDGEVTAILEPERKPAPKQPPYYMIVVGTVLACLLYLAVSLLLPLFTPSATVLIIPTEQHIATTTAIQVHGRILPALTLSQSQTAPATGRRHQSATQAQGEITFYNGLLSSQTIAAGTVLTGSDGTQVATDQAAVIPAGNPPSYGQVTVSAHSVIAGKQGNIQTLAINTACCATSIVAKNTTAFTGGADARDDTIVTRQDINNVVTSLLITLGQVETAAPHVQLHPGEALITTHCTPHVSTNHKAGEEAKHVSVSVSITCSGIAYTAHEVNANDTQMLTTIARQRFGTGYIPLGDTHVTIIRATITNQAQGMVTLTVNIEATLVYHIPPGGEGADEKTHCWKNTQARTSDLITIARHSRSSNHNAWRYCVYRLRHGNPAGQPRKHHHSRCPESITVLYAIDQKTDMPERHFSPERKRGGETPILHLSLAQVLPGGVIFALHRELGFAAIMTCDGQSPQMIAAQFFPPMEMAMLTPLLLSHPHYCPNEYLIASFSGGTTETDIEKARIRLLRAKERGQWDEIMRPMRNSLSRVRQKLITLRIDVRSIFETGYTLISYTESQYRRMRRHEK
jgi:hypothetical protein